MSEQRHTTAAALTRWYGEQPAVFRLWAIQPEPVAGALRVVLQLKPSPDGDETSPVWMAHGAAWTSDLQQRLSRAVQLERVDDTFVDQLEVNGDSRLVAALCCRDSTALATSSSFHAVDAGNRINSCVTTSPEPAYEQNLRERDAPKKADAWR